MIFNLFSDFFPNMEKMNFCYKRLNVLFRILIFRLRPTSHGPKFSCEYASSVTLAQNQGFVLELNAAFIFKVILQCCLLLAVIPITIHIVCCSRMSCKITGHDTLSCPSVQMLCIDAKSPKFTQQNEA